MEFNVVDNIEYCRTLVQESYPLGLIYYSHFSSIAAALIVSLIVFIKGKKDLSSKLLLFVSLIFSIWVGFNVTMWVNSDSKIIMLLWSFAGILIGLLFVLSLYLSYVFINRKDAGVFGKIFFGLLLLPTIIFTPTRYNLLNFSISSDCEATEGVLFTNYYYSICLLIFFWILWIAIFGYRKAEKEFKRQIILFTIGIELFILSFFSALFISSLTAVYEMEFYGIISMAVFMGFLAYLIVKFKAFDIKMLAAEALVVGLVILLFSEFFFIGIENTTVTILISVTIILSTLFGIWLINSVRNEVQRKEELQLMSGKLSEANDQLVRLDNSKSEFISIASHQLRTPLTAIKGFVSLLLEGSYGKVDPKQGEVLNKVYSSNERMVNLVEDLLNVSRMESGRMEFKFTPCKVDDICQEVVDAFFPKAKKLGLYLDYKKPTEHIPEVMIDGTKVREVISNLVDNALKYTPKGGVSLRVELASSSKYQVESSKDNNVIRVTVSDTGIGVPVTELPYLFAKFSRGKDISRLNATGTGLGLFVGKSMIEQNGGKIWAESDGEGKGSRFIIEIPLKQSAELVERWG